MGEMSVDYSSILDEFLEFQDKINVARILPYLRASDQLTDGEIGNIKNANSKAQTELLKLIRRKCPSAFVPFYESLAKSGQMELASFLFERVEKEQPNYLKPVNEYLQQKPSINDKQPILPANPSAIHDNEEFYKGISDLDVPPVCGVIENLEVETVDVAPSLASFDFNNIYRNFTKPKGLALVINNRKFDSGGMPERLGTDVDSKNISNLLTKLDYYVKVKNNLKAAEIIQAVEKFAKKEEHKIYDSAVVVLLSHGSHGALYGSDNRMIPIDTIVKQLNSHRCPALKDKPKIFIIQACRGDKFDSGLDTADHFSTTAGKREDQFFESSDETDADPMKKVPLEADILIAYATTPGYVSWRNSVHGSWFIQGICEVFKENAKKEEILHLFTRVNRLVAERLSGCGHVQVPEPCSRLRKKFYFFPGVYF